MMPSASIRDRASTRSSFNRHMRGCSVLRLPIGTLVTTLVLTVGLACGSDSPEQGPTGVSTLNPTGTGVASPTPPGTNESYPAPEIVTPLPEGKLIVEGPANQSSIFVLEGDRVTRISPGRGYSIAPDGSGLITKSDADRLTVRTLDGSEIAALDADGGVLWLPGSNRFATQFEDEVIVGDTNRGPIKQMQAPRGARIQAWRADGLELFLSVSDPGREVRLVALDAIAGLQRELATIPEVNLAFVNFSPDGRFVSYFTTPQPLTFQLSVLEFATGRTCVVTERAAGGLSPNGVAWSPFGNLLQYALPLFDGIRTSEIRVFGAEDCTDMATTGTGSLGAGWSPDGAYLAVLNDVGDRAALWSPNAQIREVEVAGMWFEWSPDGASIASVRNNPRPDAPEYTVGFTNIESGDYTASAITVPIDSMRWSPGGRYVVIGRELVATPTEPGNSQLLLVDFADGRVFDVWNEDLGYRPVTWVPD